MFKTLTNTQKGMVLILCGYTGFAFADTASKWLTDSFHAFQVTWMVQSMAALILLCSLPFTGVRKTVTQISNPKIHALRAALNASIAFLIVYCFTILPLADIYTMLFTKPFFAALLAFLFYGQKLKPHHMIAILVGFAGVFIALNPGQEGIRVEMLLPLLLGALIALMFTVSKSLEGDSAFSLGFYPFFFTSLIALPLMLPHFVMPDMKATLLVLMCGGLGAFGIPAVSKAFRLAPAAAVSPFIYTEMIWAILFGYVLFHDIPSGAMLLGAGLIIASGLYLIWKERKNPAT